MGKMYNKYFTTNIYYLSNTIFLKMYQNIILFKKPNKTSQWNTDL